MNRHYTYLLINVLTVFFPVVLSFDRRVHFFRSWKFIFPGLFLTGLLFLLWDYLFTISNVWSFNEQYITGIYLIKLPVEEILFFITVPFACVFIYECLNAYLSGDIIGMRGGMMINLMMIVLSMAMLVLYHDKVYTVITFGLLLLLALYVHWVKPFFIGRFYLAFIISLLPFYIVNGYLTALPVVLYNDGQNCAVRVGTIPLEDHFYSLSLLLLNIIWFEYFRKRSSNYSHNGHGIKTVQ